MTESVWDYPRPPRVDPSSEHVVVTHGGLVVADTTASVRVLETSHPPTYYLPAADFAEGVLRPGQGASWCEWKGQAAYYDLVTPSAVAPRAAWTYPTPTAGFTAIAGAIAVMAAQVDRCTVNGEQVVAQPGGFYGGWVTSWVAGPFKGVPGSMGW